jgi:UDP-N-acetylmuramoyl-tripeptide--D-alanyl-D-alanine ligase
MNLTTEELARAVNGQVLREGRSITGASTDSRVLRSGDAFFALVPREGEGGADGHAYVADAARRGASAAVIGRPVPDLPASLGLVQVDDPLVALGRLGALWRRRMPARVVAVTGSVGKTSTKAMLGSILSPLARTVAAERSYNNEIGVPLTLLQLNRAHEFCVLEFAMRGPGEIDYLARIAQPEVAIVTRIGLSHVGRLGSLAAIAAAKGEVLPLLPRTGAAVLNRADAFFDELRTRTRAAVISFGLHGGADVRAEGLEAHGLRGTTFTCRTGDTAVRVDLCVPGVHFVENALAAAAAAHALGVELPAIAQGLSAYEGTDMRGLVIEAPGGFTVISDCYNASPTSVEAALQLLAATEGRRVLVFGDMAELGDEGPEAHQQVGARAAEIGVQLLITVGDLARLTGEVASHRGVEVLQAGSGAEAVEALQRRLRGGEVVLVKGSRVMHLEDVVRGLTTDA